MDEFTIFRITDNGQFTLEELVSFSNRHTNLIFIKEFQKYDPDVGPHYHGWFEGNLNKKTLIHYITTELHCKGNADYSISQKDLKECIKEFGTTDGYKWYSCKGKTQGDAPTEFYNIESAAVSENHEKYYLEQEKRKQKSKVKTSKLLTELLEYVKKELFEVYENQYYQIPLIILQYFNDKDKMVSNFQVENYYHYIRTHIDPEYISIRASHIMQRVQNY